MYYILYFVDINNDSPLMFLPNHLNHLAIHCGAGILFSFPPRLLSLFSISSFHMYDGPAADQRRTSREPAADKYRTSREPAANQRGISGGPVPDQLRTSGGPAADQCRASGGPAADQRWTSGGPAVDQWLTSRPLSGGLVAY